MKLPRRAGVLLPVLATLAACNVVTDGAPIWDMTWNVPAKSTSISVNTLLPSGVTSVSNGTAFQTTVSAVAPIVRVLSTDCPSCAQANGQTAPKPAFSSTGTGSASLPSSVTSATLTGDTIIVSVVNGYNFDPIKPGAGNIGSIKLTATSGTTQLGTQTFTGTTSSIPAGATTVFKLPISGTVGSAGITVTAVIDSPAGDPIVIDASRTLTINASAKGATTNTLLISGATVNLGAGQAVTASPTNFDLRDIDASVRKRVLGGSLFLTIANPFGVSGNLTTTITGGSSPVTKSFALKPSVTADVVRLDFTADEIQRILGSNNTLTFGGTVTGTTAVTPGQTVAVATRLQLTLCTESTSANTCK